MARVKFYFADFFFWSQNFTVLSVTWSFHFRVNKTSFLKSDRGDFVAASSLPDRVVPVPERHGIKSAEQRAQQSTNWWPGWVVMDDGVCLFQRTEIFLTDLICSQTLWFLEVRLGATLHATTEANDVRSLNDKNL